MGMMNTHANLVNTADLLTSNLILDTHEPQLTERLVKQSLTVERKALNQWGYADYLWAIHGGYEQAERKQVGEIMADPDAVEDQIRGEISRHPEIGFWLIVEGILDTGPNNSSVVMKPQQCGRDTKHGRILEKHYMPSYNYKRPPELLEGMLTALERVGVRVRRTQDALTTAKVLVNLVKSGQQPHTILQRHTKPITTSHPNEAVQLLVDAMSRARGNPISNIVEGERVGISVERAELLIAAFGSTKELLGYSPEYINGVVPKVPIAVAHRMLEAFSKEG